MQLSETIAHDLNPDLIKPPPVGLLPKLRHFFVEKIFLDEISRHLFFIDLPLAVVGAICIISGISKLDLFFMVLVAIFAIDTVICILQKIEIETWTSVDSDYVYELSTQRIQAKGNRYLEVLNREDANAVEYKDTHDSFDKDSQEDSFYETKGSDFNAAEENSNNNLTFT